MNRRLFVAILLVVLSTVMRVVPHPLNLTPVGAVALFSGACFERKRWSFLVPLAALVFSDALLQTWSVLTPIVYATFAINIAIGLLIRNRRQSPAVVAAGAVTSSTVFFVVTNFAMWTISEIFPRTFTGLVACYIAGIPFFGNMLTGDLVYSSLLFGSFVWFERRHEHRLATS